MTTISEISALLQVPDGVVGDGRHELDTALSLLESVWIGGDKEYADAALALLVEGNLFPMDDRLKPWIGRRLLHGYIGQAMECLLLLAQMAADNCTDAEGNSIDLTVVRDDHHRPVELKWTTIPRI